MKRLLFLLMIISTGSFSQTLDLVSATMQTINQGAAAVSVTNYKVTLKKKKCGNWSIDSVTSLLGHRIEYNLVKAENQTAVPPVYKQVKSFNKKDKGTYLITFASRKSRGSGRPNSPQNLKVDTENYTGGVIIYYTYKKHKGQMKLLGFEELDSIDAP